MVTLKEALEVVRNVIYKVTNPNGWYIGDDKTYTIIKGDLQEYNIGDPYWHSPSEHGVVEKVKYNSNGTRDLLIKWK